MLAKITGVDAMKIDTEESKLLSEGIVNVSKHYNTLIDAKTADWLVLLGVVATIYGPRIMLLMRKPEKKAPTVQPVKTPENDLPVTPFYDNLPPIGQYQ